MPPGSEYQVNPVTGAVVITPALRWWQLPNNRCGWATGTSYITGIGAIFAGRLHQVFLQFQLQPARGLLLTASR